MKNKTIHAALVCALLYAANAGADKVYLNSGDMVEGTILSANANSVRLKGTIGGGTAEIPYPIALIEKIEFQRDDKQNALIASPTKNHLGELMEWWRRREAFIAIPESDSGEIGIAVLRASLAAGTKKAAREALEIAEALKQDWSQDRKTESERLRLMLLAKAGKGQQALKEAEALENLSGEDDAALAALQTRAQFVKARLAWDRVRKLERDWPKWHLMTDRIVERERHLNEALDAYLFAAVFHAELTDLCAEGLWEAANIYKHIGRSTEARQCAEEIVNHFPSAAYLEEAKKFP
jgi:hypothetical protein